MDFDPNSSEPYAYRSFGGEDRTAVYVGDCIACGRRTWGHTDQDNDVRGVLGKHTLYQVDHTDFPEEMLIDLGLLGIAKRNPQVACWGCMGSRGSYDRALELTLAHWADMDAE